MRPGASRASRVLRVAGACAIPRRRGGSKREGSIDDSAACGRSRAWARAASLWTVLPAWNPDSGVFVLATVATVVGARATTHAPAAQVAVTRSASLQPSMAGGAKHSAPFKHRTAVRGHLPTAIKRSHPRELRLKAAHGKVFDVRKLKSVVAKKERPERTAPGFAPAGSRAAEKLENPTRTAPQLPKVIKRSQMLAAAGPGSRRQLRRPRLRELGRRPSAGHERRRRPDLLHPDDQHLDRHLRQVDRQPRRGVHVQRVHEPGALREPLRHGQLRRPGRPLRQLRGPLVHHRLRLQARRLGQRRNPPDAFQCFAVSKTGDPVNGGWNFYSIVAPGGARRLPEVRRLAGRHLHVGEHVRLRGGRVVHRASTSGRSTSSRCTRARRAAQVVDFAGDTSDFTVIPANARLQTGTPPAGSSGVLRLDRAVPERAVDLQVPRRLGQDLDLDVHRADDAARAELLAERDAGERVDAGATRPTCSRSARWRRPSTRTSAAPSRSGSTTPSSAASVRRTRPATPRPRQRDRPLVPGERHRRHRRGERRPGHDVRPGRREHVLPLHAEPRRRPRRRHGGRLHASRTRPRTRRSSTRAGSPATRSTRSARPSRR